MAGDALAKIRCDKCGNESAQVKKLKNSPLLYVHCSCGCIRSSGALFQKKLSDAVAGISESDQAPGSEISDKISEDWKPDTTTQSAPLAEIAEIQQPTPAAAPKGKTAKKVAGFGLFALALLGLAFKVAK